MVHAIKLNNFGKEEYISRSEAKKLFLELDKFEKIVLDFEGIKTVGQGFIDEVFRVFQQSHQDINIEYINANEDITFMIKRSVNAAR